jgi:hypothetical protein
MPTISGNIYFKNSKSLNEKSLKIEYWRIRLREVLFKSERDFAFVLNTCLLWLAILSLRSYLYRADPLGGGSEIKIPF